MQWTRARWGLLVAGIVVVSALFSPGVATGKTTPGRGWCNASAAIRRDLTAHCRAAAPGPAGRPRSRRLVPVALRGRRRRRSRVLDSAELPPQFGGHFRVDLVVDDGCGLPPLPGLRHGAESSVRVAEVAA